MVAEEVFIIDGVRADGTPYVTSVSTMAGLSTRPVELGIKAGRVSRWQRDGAEFHYTNVKTAADWRLAERFAL